MINNQNNNPLVSIITPFLNTEKYFVECIESVINQKYTNWELMLVDDGSTDKSTEIAKDYALKYPRQIIYLQHENHLNRGASASRNLGIKSSKGEYIAFLDSDDIYLPNKLKDQVPILNAQQEAGMLYSSTEYWYSWSGLKEDLQKDWVWDNFGVSPDSLIAPPNLLISFLKFPKTVPCMGSILVRRKAIESVGGWENSFTHIFTDQVFHAKICLDWPVFVCSGCWDRYRQHSNSSYQKVKRNKDQAFEAKAKYFKWLKGYLLHKQVDKHNTDLWIVFKDVSRPFQNSNFYKFFKLLKKIYRRIIPKKFRSITNNI